MDSKQPRVRGGVEDGRPASEHRLQEEACKQVHTLIILLVLTMWVMFLRGGTVGMPSNGKSMVAISSNTSACQGAVGEGRVRTL